MRTTSRLVGGLLGNASVCSILLQGCNSSSDRCVLVLSAALTPPLRKGGCDRIWFSLCVADGSHDPCWANEERADILPTAKAGGFPLHYAAAVGDVLPTALGGAEPVSGITGAVDPGSTAGTGF